MQGPSRGTSVGVWRRAWRLVTLPLWNSHERRLRALWRLVLAWLAMALAELALGQLLSRVALTAARSLVWSLLGLVPLGVALWLAGRLLDRRPLADFGFHLDRRWWRDFGFGLALGAGLMTGIFAVQWGLGWVTVRDALHVRGGDQPFLLALLGPLSLFVFVGISEEVTFRGYLLTNLAEGLNLQPVSPRWAVALAWLISSALFGWVHANNPNATLVSTLYLMLAGMFLGLGFVLTGNLAIPIGLHITWNFFEGNVFGFPVSGIDLTQATVLSIRQAGPALWTGGPFGPEAGLLGLLAGGVGALAIV
ncbi:MAG: CPBP family intramembrane metalloprotease, partial [Anaerolineae bacterium]|nr:CPBP family intramembrane metalloprotease [Anaerolineae bacterium]